MKTNHRVGLFFILVGLTLFVLFLVSILSKLQIVYLLLSIVFLFLGFLLRRNKPVIESGRFGTIRRITGWGRQKDDENEDEED